MQDMNVGATNTKRLVAFKSDFFRKVLKLSWVHHRINKSILQDIGAATYDKCQLTEIAVLWPSNLGPNLYTHFLDSRIDGMKLRGRP